MSSAMIRGLALVEAVGAEPGSVSDLARRLELDKAVVSRLVTAAEADGWLVRRGALVDLGPRAAALGRSSEARELERLSVELAHALAGATGLDAIVVQFAGDRGHPLAFAPGIDPVITTTSADPFPLFATATGLTLAAGMDPEEVERRLEQPLPRYTARTVADPAEIRRRIAAVRDTGRAREDGEFADGVGCVAVAWPHPLAVAPTSISIVGAAARIDADEPLVRRVLDAAVTPNAGRATIVAAAAT